MKQSLIGIVLSFLSSAALGQTEIDCEKFRTEQINISSYQKGDIDRSAVLDLNIVINCLNFDSLDRKLWNSETLTSIIIDLSKDDSEMKYGTVLDYIEGTMNTFQYRKDRILLGFLSKYEKRAFNELDSIEMSDDLRRMGFTDPQVATYFEIVFTGRKSNDSFVEDFVDFYQSTSLQSENHVDKNRPSDLLFGHFKEIDTIVELNSHLSSNRPVLIYFSAETDVECRRMEQLLFQDPDISKILTEYICFVGYVDNNTQATTEQKTYYPSKKIETKGDFISEFEIDIYNRVAYPVLLIVDSQHRIIDIFEYGPGKSEFIQYLKKNKNVR